IADHTIIANPRFDIAPSAVQNSTVKIPKTAFKSIGSLDTAKMLVRLKFKKGAEKGFAFIKISGQKDSVKLIFSPVKSSHTVTLLDSTTVVQLDTFKKNTANQYPIKLYLMLGKATGTDTTIYVRVAPVGVSKSIELMDNQYYHVKIAAGDWSSKKDTTINKNVNLFVRQVAPVTNEQDAIINLGDVGDRHIVKFMPSKLKTGGIPFQLIEQGRAEIVKVSKAGITRETASATNVSIDTVTIRIRLHGTYDDEHNQLAFAFLDTGLNKNFQIVENPVTINRKEWNDAINHAVPLSLAKNDIRRLRKIDTLQKELVRARNHMQMDSIKAMPVDTSIQNKISRLKIILPAEIKWENSIQKDTLIDIPLHVKALKLNDSLNNVQNLDIVLKGQSNVKRGSQRVKVSIQDKPFWAELGTNFDLLDNIKTNNFYAGVYMFDKDVARIGGTKGVNNISFTGGVYESQSISTRTTSSAGYAFRDPANVHLDTGTVSANTTIKSIGVLFSLHWKLTEGKTDANGFHLFGSFYSELLWQTVSTAFKYPNPTLNDVVASPPMDISKYPFKANSITFDFRSHYQGFGLPMYVKEAEFNLYVNPVIGLTSQKFYISSNNNVNQSNSSVLPAPLNENYIRDLTFLSPRHPWNGFFLFQFRLNEVTYGITFSGEIREMMLQNAKPIITLALSKKFDLSQVLKPVVGKF
ncbi:MAG: hypothetical protein ACXVAU_16340, partial [Mucilaginibacter sp.]